MADPEHRLTLAALFSATYDDLHAYAMRPAGGDEQHARDLVQEAFHAAARSRLRLQEMERDHQLAWLKRVIRNKWIDEQRKGRTAVKLEGFLRPLPVPDTADVALNRLVLKKCWKVIATLPPKRQEVAFLVWQEQVPPTIVAQLLEISQATVRVHLHKARQALEEAVGDELPFPLPRRTTAAADDVEDRRRGA